MKKNLALIRGRPLFMVAAFSRAEQRFQPSRAEISAEQSRAFSRAEQRFQPSRAEISVEQLVTEQLLLPGVEATFHRAYSV